MPLDPTRKRRKYSIRRNPGLTIEPLESRFLLSVATFTAPVATQIIAGIFPVVATATGDLNGDGIPDLVVDRSNLTAQVFLGTANGGFILSNIYPTGGTSIALGDFTGDGKLDLATANGILPGDGKGDFGTAIPGFTLPAHAVNLYAEDVMKNGVEDLIVSTLVSGSGTGANANPVLGITVLSGNGNGTFKPAVPIRIGSAANLTIEDARLAFGDFNRDTILDAVTPFGVALGNSDGTFGTALPFPFMATGAGSPVLPTAALFAVGDFNGDSNMDIATLPAVNDPGHVEIFLGKGTGAFTDHGAVSLGAANTITSLATDVLTRGGNFDLVAGVVTSSGASDIAVFPNLGSANFSSPALYAIGGPSVEIFTADFNADGSDDILSIDQPLGASGSGTVLDAVSAAVLINSALPAAALGLTSSANPVVAGTPVTFTAVVHGPAKAHAPAPTGNVNFFDGTTPLGTATLTGGKASMTVTESVIGEHKITFVYSGDAHYASTVSSALGVIVLQKTAKVPIVIPTIGTVKFPAEFLPGDKGSVTVMLTNGGGAVARGRVGVNLFLSADGTLNSAIPLHIPALANRRVNIASGRSLVLTGNFTAEKYPAGFYMLLAVATPISGLTSDQVSPTPVAAASMFQAAGLVFGTIDTHRNVKLKVADSSGHFATLSITGPGIGTITQSSGNTNLTVTGTTRVSTVTIASHGPFILDDVTVSGVLNSFNGRFVTLAGNLDAPAGIRQLNLASANSSTGSATAITLGGSLAAFLSLGSVGDLTLTSAAPINSLGATFWQAGAIDAPSIACLVVRRTFSADVRIHGRGKLLAARIGSVSGGTWSIAGGIGDLRILGSLSGASIYAGADTGPDDLTGTADDKFTSAAIASLFVGGADTSSLIIAGAASYVTGTDTSGLTLLPRGAILSVTVNGQVSADSRFLAAHLPRIAKLAGMKVTTKNDAHFTA